MCAIVGWIVDQRLEAFTEHYPAVIMTFIGGWALSAAAMILNDYFDIEIDKINQPQRPLPSGEIKPKTALIVGLSLVGVGILMGLGIDLYEFYVKDTVFGVALITAIVNSILLLSYTNYLKKYSILGNLAVSAGVWFGFLYGDLIVDFSLNVFPESLGFAAFLLNFGREVAKGIIDIEGDRQNGVTTVATAFGKKWTAVTAAVIFMSAVGSVILPVFIEQATWAYLGSILVPITCATVCSIWILISQSDRAIKIIKTIILFTMLLALISFTLEALLHDILSPVIA